MNIEDTRIFMGGIFNQQNSVMGQNNQNTMGYIRSSNGQQNALKSYYNGNVQQDEILQKRQEARKKAVGLIKDVFVAEKAIDDDLKERQTKVNEANQDIQTALDELKELEKQKEELKNIYGDTEEYQRLAAEVDAYGEPFRMTIEDAKKVIVEENAIIRGIRLERLKSQPMTEATKQADEIMESANKEIIGMIVDAAKETVDANMEEAKEEMEAAKEDAEELEEQVEKVQQRNDELEASIEARRKEKQSDDMVMSDIPVEQMLELDTIKTEVKQEVENIIHEMKLLTEDLKGTVVDINL